MTAKTRPDASLNPDAVLRRSLSRSGLSIALWLFGIAAILMSMLSATLQVTVPLFALDNEAWRRADNPHNLRNLLLMVTAGVTAIYAARSTDRRRLWLAVGLVVISTAYGLWSLGLLKI